MASPTQQRDKLDELHATIVLLRGELVQREREAGELLDGEKAAADAGCRVVATRMLLDAAKDKYIAENEAARSLDCPIHGPNARIVACSDCVRLSPELRPYHEAYQRAVALDEAAAAQ